MTQQPLHIQATACSAVPLHALAGQLRCHLQCCRHVEIGSELAAAVQCSTCCAFEAPQMAPSRGPPMRRALRRRESTATVQGTALRAATASLAGLPPRWYRCSSSLDRAMLRRVHAVGAAQWMVFFVILLSLGLQQGTVQYWPCT